MNNTNDLLVVKIGGGAGLDMDATCTDLADIALERPTVVLHGVSATANRLGEERGHPAQTLTSPTGHTSRYTDPTTRDIYVEAAQMVNDDVVRRLRERGVDAVGITGLIHGTRKKAVRAVVDGRVRVVRDDYTGSITGVSANRIREELSAGRTVVLPPMAYDDSDGYLNVDGDRAAAAVADALGANTLVILSNVRGLYRDFPNEDSFVPTVAYSQINTAMEWAQGRMKRKVLAAQEALDNRAVTRVIIADGRIENPLRRALDGDGTVFSR